MCLYDSLLYVDIGHETLDMHNDYVFPERASVLVSMNNMVVELVVLNCCGATQSGVYNLCVGDISNYCQGFKGEGGGGEAPTNCSPLLPPPEYILYFLFPSVSEYTPTYLRE